MGDDGLQSRLDDFFQRFFCGGGTPTPADATEWALLWDAVLVKPVTSGIHEGDVRDLVFIGWMIAMAQEEYRRAAHLVDCFLQWHQCSLHPTLLAMFRCKRAEALLAAGDEAPALALYREAIAGDDDLQAFVAAAEARQGLWAG